MACFCDGPSWGSFISHWHPGWVHLWRCPNKYCADKIYGFADLTLSTFNKHILQIVLVCVIHWEHNQGLKGRQDMIIFESHGKNTHISIIKQ